MNFFDWMALAADVVFDELGVGLEQVGDWEDDWLNAFNSGTTYQAAAIMFMSEFGHYGYEPIDFTFIGPAPRS